MRDGGGGGDGAAKDAPRTGASKSAWSPPPPEPAIVDWAYGTSQIAEDGGPCVALSPNGDLVCFGGIDGRLKAVSANGGARWNPDLGDPPLGGGVVGTPVVTADGAYCIHGNGTRLFALDLEGHVRWRRVFDKETYGARPMAAGGLLIVATTTADPGSVRAYRSDGSLAWQARLPGKASEPPMVADGVVYAPTTGALTAWEAESGTRLWSCEVDDISP